MLVLVAIVASAATAVIPVSATRTSLLWFAFHEADQYNALSQPRNLTAGYWMEIDFYVSSGSMVFYLVDNSDWYAHNMSLSLPSPFDHPYANVVGVPGNSTAYAPIPSTGQYWLILSTFGSSFSNNTGLCEIWLWDQNPAEVTFANQVTLSLISIGVLGTALVLISVSVLRARRRNEPSKLATIESGSALSPNIETVADVRQTASDLGAPSSGKCIVCNMQIRQGDPFVRCPSCGNIAHRVHMLEWLHVRDYCPICGKHLSERSLA